MALMWSRRGNPWPLRAIVIFVCITAAQAWSEQAHAISQSQATDATTSATRAAPDANASASRSGADAASSASRAARKPGDISTTLYDLAQGPVLRLCLLVAFLGILYRILQYRRLTRKTPVRGRYFSPAVAASTVAPLRRAPQPRLMSHPAMRTVSLSFHILLFLVPLLLPAHTMLLSRSLHASLPAIPAPLADWLTVVLVALGAFFLVRRIAVPRVRILSTTYDYVVLLLVLAPFVTGLMAYHHVSSSPWLMVAHVASGDALLLAIPFTKLGHMPFLVFSRFFVSGEYSWRRQGKRAWGKSA